MESSQIDRRAVLRGAVVLPLALAAAPGVAHAAPHRPSFPAGPAFVDVYRTNLTTNLTPGTNAAVRILSGMSSVWRTGTGWNDGEVLDRRTLRDSMEHVVGVTRSRTAEEAGQSFVYDRCHQSYSVTAGLGPLTASYRAGARAVTSITSAPDGTPDGRVSDSVPADAPAGSALGAGAPDSELGEIVRLVDTVRGPFSSSNPAKLAYQYPRPWRMTRSSTVVDTGRTDAYGYPVYDSRVVVTPQLLRQRSTEPADDGGFVSGHTNASWLAALAYAYAVPERFQKLLVTAAELGHSRIVSGMHSAVDVVGGRVLATALAAAILADPANAELKAAARDRAVAYFGADALADARTTSPREHAADARLVTARLTYTLRRTGRPGLPLTPPKGAEVLLETRFPYLSAAQRRDVLRTTALDSGYPILDGPEQWGRLDLFTAADGFGRFDGDVTATLDPRLGGMHATDTWRHDISGRGGLTKAGAGTLTLAGHNVFRGDTVVSGGTLEAASTDALGRGDVTVAAGATLRSPLTSTTRVHGVLTVAPGAVLDLTAPPERRGGSHVVLRARRIHGAFETVRLDGRTVAATQGREEIVVHA